MPCLIFHCSEVMDHLMICGQSLQALALRFARASQAGSVETWVVSPGGKRFVTSFVAGGDGVESVISTVTELGKVFAFFKLSRRSKRARSESGLLFSSAV